jgi:predicted anti-sigma-YlaC factor YlaD
MDCTDIKVVLSGLVDDELDAGTRHAAERHLAECAACRDLVGEVEAVNQLIAADATQRYGREDLPHGFMDTVLGRTVAEDRRRATGAWVNWLGWLAAAACLLLAVSAWLMQDGGGEPSTPRGLVVIGPPEPASIQPASYLQSTVYEGDMALDDLVADGGASTSEDVFPSASAMSREDAETLDATSQLLEMLLMADRSSFSDVERIREMAEYDEMLARLAEARNRIPAVDRTAVFAAESVLLRIVNGPLSLEDVQALQETVRQSELATHLGVLSARGLGKTTL